MPFIINEGYKIKHVQDPKNIITFILQYCLLVSKEILDSFEIEEYCQEYNCKECTDIFTRHVTLAAYLIYNKEEFLQPHIQKCHNDEYVDMLNNLDTYDNVSCATCLRYINEHIYASRMLGELISMMFDEHSKDCHNGKNVESLYGTKHYAMLERYADHEFKKMTIRWGMDWFL